MTSTTTEAGSQPPDQTTPLLELRGVNKSFGAVQVLHDVDLDGPPRSGDGSRR